MKTEPIFQPSTNLAPFLAIALSGLAIAICLAAHVRAQELQLIESRPLGGTFYSLQKLDREPPLPYNRFPELPLYWLGEGIYAVDDRSVDYVALAQQAELEAALSAMESTLDGPPAPGEGGGDPGTNSVPPAYSYSTNDLWLEMAGLTNDTAYLVVHSPEPDGVFDLFATTNLSPNGSGLNLTNWAWLARSEPGQTNFVVVELSATETWFRLGRTNDADADGLTDAFENLVSHSDPQEADSDADGLPDGWEWKHFGNFGQGAGDDYDQDDVSNLDEYYAGSDPNSIAFRTIFNNLRVNSTGATGTVTVIKGVPAKLAVLVDSTNFASASWVSYGSTFNGGTPRRLGRVEGAGGHIPGDVEPVSAGSRHGAAADRHHQPGGPNGVSGALATAGLQSGTAGQPALRHHQ
jgi:hypothetical protein